MPEILKESLKTGSWGRLKFEEEKLIRRRRRRRRRRRSKKKKKKQEEIRKNIFHLV